MTKTCSKCKAEKPLSMYYEDKRRKDGKQSHCKCCFKAYRDAIPETMKQRKQDWNTKNKEKIKEYSKEYYAKNSTSIKEKALNYHAENRESLLNKMKLNRLKNIESYKTRSNNWKKNNPGAANALNAKRRASQLQATPTWADFEAIEREYELAAWCSKVTGEQYHVDHIIPLQGKRVCGLHVHTNLRVIMASENIAKNNRFEVL